MESKRINFQGKKYLFQFYQEYQKGYLVDNCGGGVQLHAKNMESFELEALEYLKNKS